VAQVNCSLPLGRHGLTVHNELLLDGWAVSPKGVSGVAVQIGDRQWNASYGLDTSLPTGAAEDVPGADRCGYRLCIDTAGWEPGPHYVTVAAFDVEGGRAAIEGTVQVRPFDAPCSTIAQHRAALAEGRVAMSLDSPCAWDGVCEVDGALEISGWAHAENGIEAVLVTLDRHVQYEALRPIVYPKLLGDLGRDTASKAGFVLRVDPADCPPGRHHLTVVAIGRDGHATGIEQELSVLPDPEPKATDHDGATLDVDWMTDREAPTLQRDAARPTEKADLERLIEMWEDRALLAEADAALSRAEAGVAKTQQEDAMRMLAHVQAHPNDLAAVHEEDLTRRIAAYEQSLSWRITRPLRAIIRRRR
jgi:hypothetical protein